MDVPVLAVGKLEGIASQGWSAREPGARKDRTKSLRRTVRVVRRLVLRGCLEWVIVCFMAGAEWVQGTGQLPVMSR